MTDGTLPFSSTEYDKLGYSVFPTIRRRDKYGDVGDVNEIRAGERGERITLGRAKIIGKDTVTVDGMNHRLLEFDTNATDMTEAWELLNSFYRNEIDPHETLTLYWNVWVDKESGSSEDFE